MTQEASPVKESRPAWIPMRQNGLGQPHRMEVGAFSWTPSFILYGNRLEVNSKVANNLVTSLQLTKAIEIGSFNPPKDGSSTVIGSVSQNGEATVIGIKGRVKRPKNTATIFPDVEGKKISLLVNFSGIADYVESRLSGGAENPNFYPRFGKEVNKAVTKKLKLVPAMNWTLQALDNPGVLGAEAMVNFMSIMPGLIIHSSETVRLLLGKSEGVKEMLPLFLTSVVMYETVLLIFNALTVLNSRMLSSSNNSMGKDYAEYLIEGFSQRKLGRFFYPENLTKYLFLPTMKAIMSRETLIQGNNLTA